MKYEEFNNLFKEDPLYKEMNEYDLFSHPQR
jgi:hypothetical protein